MSKISPFTSLNNQVKWLPILLCVLWIGTVNALPISVFKNMAELRSQGSITAGMVQGTTITLLGYYKESDGGGGDFYLNLSQTDADNGGTIIAPTTGASLGRWVRVCPPGRMNVLWFGARPYPGVTGDQNKYDSYDAIVAAYKALQQTWPSATATAQGQIDETGNVVRSGTLYFPQVTPASNGTPQIYGSSSWYFMRQGLTVSFPVTIKGDGPWHSCLGLWPASYVPNGGGSTESFVIRFARNAWSYPSAANSFESVVEDIDIDGGGQNNSSGIFMSGAQMCRITNTWVSSVALRGIVAGYVKLDNVEIENVVRGPALDIHGEASGDATCTVSNLAINFCNLPCYKTSVVSGSKLDDGDYYPAIQLLGATLSADTICFESCPILVKGQGSHFFCNVVKGGQSDATVAAKTDTTLFKFYDCGKIRLPLINMNNFKGTTIRKIDSSGNFTGPVDMTYGANSGVDWRNAVESFETNAQGGVSYKDGWNSYNHGSGYGAALRVFAKPQIGSNNWTTNEGNYIAEFFTGSLYGDPNATRMFAVGKDGSLLGVNNQSVSMSTSTKTLFAQPSTNTAVSLPAIAAASETSITLPLTLPTGISLRPGDSVQAGLALSGIVSGVGGAPLPAGVTLLDAVVSGANQVKLRFRNLGTVTSTAASLVYKITVMNDAR